MKRKTTVIYHADCPDGAASAMIARQRFGDSADYVPMAYAPHPVWQAYYGHDVYFVDFSWPRDALEALATIANEVHVIDHHKTAQAALADIPQHAPGRAPIAVTFNMDKCGAVLTFEALFPGRQVPDFYLYIQDRDLWQWKLPSSREIAAAVATYGRTLEGMAAAFDEWTVLGKGRFVDIGARVLALQQQMTEKLGRTAKFADFHGYQVPIANVPQETGLQSEVGEWLCQEYRSAPFAVCYGDIGHQRRYSLRSKKDANGVIFDCSTLAKQFGGGGHMGAAGFTAPIS